MSLPSFPVLPGVGWDIKKTLINSTRILTARSGKEYRAQNWANNLYSFEIPLNFLRQYGLYTELATIEGFILSQAGSFNQWTYSDPFDHTATAQNVGLGDGTTLSFPLDRTIGSYSAPVNYANSLDAVYLNGIVQATNSYTLTQTGIYGPDTILFNTAPGSNVVVSADFTWSYVCRFETDEPEFKNFIGGRWSNDGMAFRSVK